MTTTLATDICRAVCDGIDAAKITGHSPRPDRFLHDVNMSGPATFASFDDFVPLPLTQLFFDFSFLIAIQFPTRLEDRWSLSDDMQWRCHGDNFTQTCFCDFWKVFHNWQYSPSPKCLDAAKFSFSASRYIYAHYIEPVRT